MNYWQNYWRQTANPFVSGAVLMGGLVSGLILFMLVRIESKLDAFVDFAPTVSQVQRYTKP
ncbi:hypothetical protein KW790_01065 [Candidatus Parcubacteria bacterium]|nr:hypothetical protein [Candidatus Parcubacteria bacterium]